MCIINGVLFDNGWKVFLGTRSGNKSFSLTHTPSLSLSLSAISLVSRRSKSGFPSMPGTWELISICIHLWILQKDYTKLIKICTIYVRDRQRGVKISLQNIYICYMHIYHYYFIKFVIDNVQIELKWKRAEREWEMGRLLNSAQKCLKFTYLMHFTIFCGMFIERGY